MFFAGYPETNILLIFISIDYFIIIIILIYSVYLFNLPELPLNIHVCYSHHNV